MTATKKLDLDALLSSQYFVVGLDEALRDRLLASATQQPLAADEHLFMQGDSASRFYIVHKGQLKLYRNSAKGSERIMGLVSAGDSFAEGIVFMQPPRYPVNARALVASSVVGVQREAFLAILSESFPACLSVMAQMAKRIQNLMNEIEALTLQNGRYRLIRFLYSLLPNDHSQAPTTVHLPARKREVAARLSMQPETLSRLLKLLCQDGLINVQGDRINILDPDALRKLTLP